MNKLTEILIIGGGPAGYTTALRLARGGKSVVLVEKSKVGGTCLNKGCIPAKSLLFSAERYNDFKNSSDIISSNEVTYNLNNIYAKKDETVARLRSGVEKLLSACKVEVVEGEASFLADGKVAVGDDVYEAENVVIATGGVSSKLPIEGAELTVGSDYLLQDNEDLPNEVAIIGGGVIGVEFATFLLSLDKKVRIFEYADRLLPMFEREIGQQLQLNFRKKGAQISVSTKVLAVRKADGGGFQIEYEEKGVAKFAEAELVIMCAGRRANTDGLGLERIGVKTNKGAIAVDGDFRTSVKNIFAVGDANGGIQLAHNAAAEGEYVAELLLGKASKTNFKVVPSCVYTSPEIAAVGLSQAECDALGIETEVGKFIMGANGKSVIVGKGGFIKTIFKKADGKLLGATLYCDRATDVVGELALAVANGLTREQIASTIHAHPTIYEAVFESSLASIGRAIHIL